MKLLAFLCAFIQFSSSYATDRIEFCSEILKAADRNGDGFISYAEYHLHILKQISPYEQCPPVNIFGVLLDESYVKFHTDQCEVCAEYDNDPQCCNTNPKLSKWSVPGTKYPDSYTVTICNRLLTMIDDNCGDPEVLEAAEVEPITDVINNLRYYLIVLIPLAVLFCCQFCIICLGAWYHRERDAMVAEAAIIEKSQGKSLLDDFTEDPTETECDLEWNSPRSTKSRSGNFAGMLSVLEEEDEEEFMDEFRPRGLIRSLSGFSAGSRPSRGASSRGASSRGSTSSSSDSDEDSDDESSYASSEYSSDSESCSS